MVERESTSDSPAALRRPAPPMRRHWRAGLRSLWRFVTTPSDLANSFEAMFALAGPTVEREFRSFAEHPVGRALLAERPRRDLNALLSDRTALAAMPPGSFADAYLQYLGGDDMGSAEYFLVAADLDAKARRYGWSEDHLFFVRRMANSHDLFHVLAGYGRDVRGEVGVIAYTAGQIPLLPLRMLLAYLVVMKPSQPLHWPRYVWRCYRHGRRTPSLACVAFEELLPQPLEDVRREIGIPELARVHPDGVPEKGWLLDLVERKVQLV